MKPPEFSPRAFSDLDELLEYIARDKPDAAAKFVAKLKEKCRLLARFPELGAPRVELMPTLRVFSVGNYAIYYRPLETSIRVERVLHAARDVDVFFN